MKLERWREFLIAISLIASMAVPVIVSADNDSTVIFLVRHAEKGDGPDPPLTETGQERAQTLAHMLGDSGIGQIHSTDYLRTRETAAPVAERLALEVRIYDPDRLEQLAGTLLREGGRHLVVGHSNTTAELVELLGGSPGTPIREADEYDRLYLLTISGSGAASTSLLRYGASYGGSPPTL